ncbi:MAG TPA: hypothetical protein VGB52_12765 [Actinomycetota bacterium]
MQPGQWYVVAFSIGAGVSILGFWTVVLARGLVPRLLPGPGARSHVVAELLTGGLLVAGGASLLADHAAAWAITLAGIGLGAVCYALAGSAGLYPGRRGLQGAFVVGWVFAIPAIVLLLINA